MGGLVHGELRGRGTEQEEGQVVGGKAEDEGREELGQGIEKEGARR